MEAVTKNNPSKILEVKNLTVGYKERGGTTGVLENVSFSLYQGEILGLLGDSGSGKTTLCKCILGLLQDYTGEVIHYSKSPQMVFQDPYAALNPMKTIGWILEEPLRVRRIKKHKRREMVCEILEEVNLNSDYYNRYPKELSGGQRQRVSIALALLTNPQFILADEPLSALDVTVQAQIIELIKRLQKDKGISFLFVSHDLDVVSNLCKRVLIVDGKGLREVALFEKSK